MASAGTGLIGTHTACSAKPRMTVCARGERHSDMTLTGILAMMALAFVQNVSFSMVSRSRNFDHKGYHVACAVFSNGIWYATAGFLIVRQGMPWALFLPYTVGTVAGSLTGSIISAHIEKWLGLKKV